MAVLAGTAFLLGMQLRLCFGLYDSGVVYLMHTILAWAFVKGTLRGTGLYRIKKKNLCFGKSALESVRVWIIIRATKRQDNILSMIGPVKELIPSKTICIAWMQHTMFQNLCSALTGISDPSITDPELKINIK